VLHFWPALLNNPFLWHALSQGPDNPPRMFISGVPSEVSLEPNMFTAPQDPKDPDDVSLMELIYPWIQFCLLISAVGVSCEQHMPQQMAQTQFQWAAVEWNRSSALPCFGWARGVTGREVWVERRRDVKEKIAELCISTAWSLQSIQVLYIALLRYIILPAKLKIPLLWLLL